MKDMVLLNVVAKVLGYWDTTYDCYDGPLNFDPENNSEQAFQLMVKFALNVRTEHSQLWVECSRGGVVLSSETFNDVSEALSSTRRAICYAVTNCGKF